MEVKSGHKQTEVGVIPEDWDVVEAFELDPFITSGSRGWAKFYSDCGALFMRMSNLSRESIYPDLSDRKFVDVPENETEGRRTALQDGDILISITADIGIIGYIDARIPKPAYINQHIACLRLPSKETDSLFHSYYLASHGPQRRFAEMTDVGAKTGINLTTVGKLKLLLPPLPEQHAIAEAFTDMDALLGGLDRLIAKKRDLKQAAMQQLLTGQSRLPGFHGEWEVLSFKELFNISAGGDVNPKLSSFEQDEIHQFPIYSNALTDCGLYGYCAYADHPADSITITARGTLGVATHRDHKYTAIGRVLVLQPKRRTAGQFFAEFINSRVKFAIESTGVPQLTAPQISTYNLAVPTYPEQTAIAAVLTDMDAELAALEQRREKTHGLKQAMMQELLTGKTRLV